MSGVPYTFATATTSIPLSQLDVNFATNATLGNTAVGLGNTVTTVGNLTLGNVAITSGTANVTITGGSVANSIVLGTTAGDNASAGYVGEYVDSYVSSVTVNTSATNLTSISLTAGDWDIYGNAQINGGTVGATTMSVGISTTSGSFSGTNLAKSAANGCVLSASATGGAVVKFRVNITSTTTYYLVASVNVANAGYGYICARRMR